MDISSLQLAQGISKQPAHIRFRGQVADASNAVFNLADGASKRPGSVFVAVLPADNPSGGTDFVAGGVYRLHPINRDASEKYLMVYANGVLRCFSTAGVEARVAGASGDTSGTAATYYASNVPTTNQLRFVTIADYTIVANTTVALGVTTTPTFTTTADWETYERMTSHTPTSLISQVYRAITGITVASPGVITSVAHGLTTGDQVTISGTNCFPPLEGVYTVTVLSVDTFHVGVNIATVGTRGSFSTSTGVPSGTGDLTYHKTNKDSAAQPAGYYLYSVNSNFFPTIQFPVVSTVPADWASSTFRGFRIRFEKRQSAFTGASYSAATNILTKTNAWSGYAHQAGDDIYIGTGTGVTAGWYRILRKIDNSNLLLLTDPAAGTPSDLAGSGIGQEYEVAFPGTGGTLPTMHDVAYFIQQKLQAAGCQDGLVEWTDTGTGAGYFTITGPWRGSGSKVTSVTANPSAPTAGTTDLSLTSFSPTGATRVDGAGSGPRTLPVDQRWTRVAAPGDRDGSIDTTKAPFKVVRANPAYTVTGGGAAIAVGNPPVITKAAHGLVNGQRITFSGTTSTPTFTGPYIVASVTTNTFTIAVDSDSGGPALPNVTVLGTGNYVAPAYFTYDVIPWKNRTSGSDVSNPSPSPFNNGVKVSDIGFHRQRFAMLAGETVMLSAAGDLFRFYLDDASNLVDSDPIVAPLSGDRVTIGEFLTPVRDTVLTTTFAGTHFALGAPDALTPSTVSFARAFALQTAHIRPYVLDPTVYIAATANGKSQLREALFFEDAVPSDTADISAHVAGSAGDAGLLPASPQTICAHSTTRQVFVLAPSTNKVYVYKSMWSGNRKDQSAWSVWEFGTTSNTRIIDIAVIDDDLYVFSETLLPSSQFVLEKVPLFQPALGSYPFNIHLDRQITGVTGVRSGTPGNYTTTWTLPGGIVDSSLNWAVTTAGVTLPLTSAGGGTTVTTPGDYSGSTVTLGRAYSFSLTLSEPFIRKPDGDAIIDKVLAQRCIIIRHITSGSYTVTNTPAVGTAVTYTLSPPSGTLTDSGQRMALAGGDMSKWTITISSSAATPTTICGLAHIGDWGLRFHVGGT